MALLEEGHAHLVEVQCEQQASPSLRPYLETEVMEVSVASHCLNHALEDHELHEKLLEALVEPH